MPVAIGTLISSTDNIQLNYDKFLFTDNHELRIFLYSPNKVWRLVLDWSLEYADVNVYSLINSLNNTKIQLTSKINSNNKPFTTISSSQVYFWNGLFGQATSSGEFNVIGNYDINATKLVLDDYGNLTLQNNIGNILYNIYSNVNIQLIKNKLDNLNDSLITTLTDNDYLYLSNNKDNNILTPNFISLCEKNDSTLQSSICKKIYSIFSNDPIILNSKNKMKLYNCQNNNNFLKNLTDTTSIEQNLDNCNTFANNNIMLFVNTINTYCNDATNFVSNFCVNYYKNIKKNILINLDNTIPITIPSLDQFTNNEIINCGDFTHIILLIILVIFSLLYLKKIIYINKNNNKYYSIE